MELAWDVDVFALHALHVYYVEGCARLNSLGLGRIHKPTRKTVFWGELFRESDSNFHINTHKHREWREEGVGGGAEGRARGPHSVNLMCAGWMENKTVESSISTQGFRSARPALPTEFGERSCVCWQSAVIFSAAKTLLQR